MKDILIAKNIKNTIVKSKTIVLKKTVDKEIFLHNDFNSICRITTQNTIKFCNKDFVKTSAYTEKELLNNSLELVKHPKMPKIITDYITHYIDNNENIGLIIKNYTNNGCYFWTFSEFITNTNSNYKIAYTIKSLKISNTAKTAISKLYTILYSLENKLGEEIALKYLIGFLEEKCMSLQDYTKHLITL